MMRFFIKYQRGIALLLLFSILDSIVFPSTALALTSGPSQPESGSFTPVGTTDMVSPFTGDFSYNIPLMDVGGYPINISYSGGSFMDQEASWVGLGWNINAGAINRSMRGLPDDFNGDLVIKEFNMKANETFGVTLGLGSAIAGYDGASANGSAGISYNNYNGFGITRSMGISVKPFEGFPGTVGLGLSSSEDGLTISPKVTFKAVLDKVDNNALMGSLSIGMSFNSRTGLGAMTLNAGVSAQTLNKDSHNKTYSMDGLSKSASFNFGAATYVPQVSMPMHNQSYFFSLTLGGTYYTFDGTANLAGSYSKQGLKYTTENVPAYGYMYQEYGEDLNRVLLDFNREKDGSFSENSVSIPLTNNTFDVYTVAGQGVGGSYRLFRGDIGYLFDSYTTTDSESNSLSTDLALSAQVQGGINYYNTTMDQYSGKWISSNPMAGRFHFRKKGQGNVYEPAYFKEAGEMSVDEDNLYNTVHTNTPVRFEIENGGFETWTKASFKAEDDRTLSVPVSNARTKRSKRNQLFTYLTKKEFAAVGLNKNLLGIIPAAAPNHHVAEITTTKTDGTRYIYGLPMFNTKQIECSFNISGNSPSSNGLVAYNSGTDDSKNNAKGIDNYYSSTELPPYAYAYLLTAVVSPDYVDVTGNGPSDDDLGNYTKFEYGTSTTPGPVNGLCVANNLSTADNYNWRTPYASPSAGAQANFDEGLKTEPNDNKGSYVYGEKQITFLKQITTKNHVAVFELGSRNDAVGVAGKSGGLGAAQKCLQSIKLYSKPDFIYQMNVNGNLNNATVIKQVNFEYDYSLCPGIPNNSNPTSVLGSGKLTLKKIYFTHGKSQKGRLSPYVFTYNTTVTDPSNTVLTPAYDMKAYDRWGTYKPNNPAGLPNQEFPYVDQQKSSADSYAALWNIKSITLPSGGKIDVTLESDDYAYVQNKRAAQMFKVVASDNSIPSAGSLTNFTLPTIDSLFKGGQNYTVLFFKLQEPIDYNTMGVTAAIDEFRRQYIAGLEKLYFRFFTNVNGLPSSYGFEYVSGYGEIFNSGAVRTSASTAPAGMLDYGWVQLKTVARGDKNGVVFQENPISKAAWQFGRLHMPKAVFSVSGTSPTPNASIPNFIKSVANASFFKSAVEFFLGVNGTLKAKGYGNQFQTAKSWIKLNNPLMKKLGGGNRVKQIKITDEWSSMLTTNSNNANKTSEYGQNYDYTTTDPETNSVISSGVAAYEPAFGADENSCRYPIYNSGKEEELLLAPDNESYQEGPYGETFFPSPVVGYSKVSVSSLTHAGVTKNRTGKLVNEFYTAKDFPVIVKQPTDLFIKRLKSNPLQKILSMNFTDNVTVSQGYCIEVNDMHGKPKGTTVYDAQDNLVNTTTYVYKESGGTVGNEVPVLAKDGTISNKTVGVNFDMVADFREQGTYTETTGIQGNLYFMLIGIWPLLVPPIIPSYHKESVRFRSAGVTKLVNRFGILEKTINKDLVSKVEVVNHLWDAETGQVLLTSTNTEFKDNVYNFNYPAYFAYSGMEPAYKNIGMEFALNTLANSAAGPTFGKVNTNYLAMLEPGDEFIILNNGTPLNNTNLNENKCWVSKKGGDYYLVDKDGVIIFSSSFLPGSGTNTLKLIRSGKRNLQSLSAGNIVSYKPPYDIMLSSTSWPVIDGSKNIIAAGAIEYSDTWRTFCNCGVLTLGSPNFNEYLSGNAGSWRQTKSYTYLTMRTQTKVNGNSNITKDGVYDKFDEFWTPNAGFNWSKPSYLNSANSKWTWANEVTEFSPQGFELENKDALERYSAAVYGYNNALPVAVGSNTRYRQLAFDNFEYYNFNSCLLDGHFDFKSANPFPTTTMPGNAHNQKFAHTGRKSVKVSAGAGVKVVKDLKPCP